MRRCKSIDLSKIACRITRDSLQVKDKELIWIVCGPHNIAFAEEIASEVALCGGYPIIELSSPYVNREIYLKAPLSYLSRPRKNIARMKEMVDGFLRINPQKDPRIMADVPFERINMVKRALEAERKVYEEMHIKRVLVEYPTQEQADFYHIPYEELFEMVWGGIEVDPEYLYKVSRNLEKAFQGAVEIEIKTEKGTDLKFSIEGRKFLHDTGVITDDCYITGEPLVNLPAGELYIAPVENSANGVVVFDEVFLEGKRVIDLLLKFKNGKVIDFSAKEGADVFKEYFQTLTLPGRIMGEFGIGLNPYVKRFTGLSSIDEKAVGTVHIALGSNTVFGGRNFAENHDDFIIQNPTVIVKDRLIIEKGIPHPDLKIKKF